MEPIKPKKGSRSSSKRSGSGSSQSERSNSRASQKSGSSRKKQKETPPTEVEKELVFDDDAGAFADDGFILDDTDSDDSEQEPEKKEVPASVEATDGEDVEPYIDEEAVKAELGGDPEETEEKVKKQGYSEIDESKENKSTEEEEGKENIKTSKKRGRKLKKTSEKRVGFDGREVVFVTEFTQTDWKWKDNAEKSGKGTFLPATSESRSTSLKSILVKPESRQTVSQAKTEDESTFDDRTGTDLTPFSLQPNDEFGIPMLDISSDSDSSDGEVVKKPKQHKHHLPTIGPPQILKYIRESDRLSKDTDKTSSDMDEEYRQVDSTDYVLDEHGNTAGMFSGPCEFCGDDIKPFPTLEQQLAQPPESLYCCEEYREFVEFAMTTANRLEEDMAKKNEKISIKVHGHHGSKQARKMAKEQAVQRMRERELQRRQQEASGMQAAFYQSAVARQMKTINYQLSSQRCLEEGWTLRAPSPLDLDDADNEVFVPEPLHPAMIASGKLNGRKLIEKFYPDGSKFLTIFPDGTGNVFYPSGRLAIVIISLTLGQNTYIVQDDTSEPELLGVFEPNGYGCCYFASGKVRLTYDQTGGIELDFVGARKRVWSWKDQETHVHAPPFQPIVFGMNRFIGVRFMAQESIALTLTGRKRSCRFNVGAKLKLVAPENIQPKGIDEHQLYINERKVRVDAILNKVTNLLKFPKSPKVDRILPPLSVASRQQKLDKMKQEYMAAVPATTPGRKSKKVVKQNRLSPLDVPAVSVN